jgi:hypothetical protein
MTDKQLAKRIAELGEEFIDMCKSRHCWNCEMKAFAPECACAHVWIMKRMKEEEVAQVRCNSSEKAVAAAPNESPKAKEEAKLPKWCKVGAWVLMNNTLYKIVEVDSGHYNPLTVKDIHGGYSFAHPNIVYPVRFRPYTYVEAKGLLGKTMEYRDKTACSFVCNSMLISRVSFDPDSGEVFIHSCRFSDWWDYEPTIDGVPIGVPEVDVEAMKECEKSEESVTCESCKHSRWFGEYTMTVCEKHGMACPEEVCGYYKQKGGEE